MGKPKRKSVGLISFTHVRMWSQVEQESELEKPATFRMVSLVLLTMSSSGNLVLTLIYILFRTHLLETMATG